MQRSARTLVGLAGLVAIVTAGVGCSADMTPAPTQDPVPSLAAESPSPAAIGSRTKVESQNRYTEAVANFPYVLPSGFTFPTEVPSVGMSQEALYGAAPAYHYWACATTLAAWGRADDGDIAGADALILTVDQAEDAYPDYFSQWEPPRSIHWDNQNERTAGESGLCSAWLQRLSGPE